MSIAFLYGRRESLTGKSEAYKRAVRKCLESEGYSQTTDSFVEGTFEDMVFYNPTVAPGRRFVVEVKADSDLSLRSLKFTEELVHYFRNWTREDPSQRFGFMLFVQGVKDPNAWERFFFPHDHPDDVAQWRQWYDGRCKDEGSRLQDAEMPLFADFLARASVTVGDAQKLDLSAAQKEETSPLSMGRLAKSLFDLTRRRREPIGQPSTIVLNILPITVPGTYHQCRTSASDKYEIYRELDGVTIPPFIWRADGTMMTFSELGPDNPLHRFCSGPVHSKRTMDLQEGEPNLASELVNIHLRRMIWNRGIYRDARADILYFPLKDKDSKVLKAMGPKGNERWVTKRLDHRVDTPYAKAGDTNFYFHRGVEFGTPTYWGTTFVELVPKRYYTLDGEKPTDGDTRAAIDEKFRDPNLDRSETRLDLMKFWKYLLFDSPRWPLGREDWFDRFGFGDFLSYPVDWSPQSLGRNQYRLWDFGGCGDADGA